MKIDIAYPRLPPVIDGVGDHTALLAQDLVALGHDVRLLSCAGADQVPGAAVVPLPATGGLRLAKAIESQLRSDADWLVLPYSSFAWGRWGVNPLLPRIARGRGRRTALLAHEMFAPPMGTRRSAVLSLLQRRQFRSLGGASDVVLFTTRAWLDEYGSWFPGAECGLMPVGSNLPAPSLPRAEAKRLLGIDADSVTVGFFGRLDGHRDAGPALGRPRRGRKEGSANCRDLRRDQC